MLTFNSLLDKAVNGRDLKSIRRSSALGCLKLSGACLGRQLPERPPAEPPPDAYLFGDSFSHAGKLRQSGGGRWADRSLEQHVQLVTVYERGEAVRRVVEVSGVDLRDGPKLVLRDPTTI